MPAQTVISSTTQQFLDIYDITNDLVIMKDGSTSLIITVDAMNFGLLAEEEQDAIMYAYAGLLNSLNYPIQIVVRSQTKDATNYLNLLREQEIRASNDEKRNQIAAYREFVADLIRERNVLDKKFYIVIPATALEMGLLPPQTVVPGVKQIDISSIERSVILEKATTILEPKRDHLIGQFARIGLYARQLVTQEIIQLFYTSYNPEAAEGQQITHTSDYTTALVSGQTQMTDATSQPAQPTPNPAVAPTEPQVVNQPVDQTTNPTSMVPPAEVQPPAIDTTNTPATDMPVPSDQPLSPSPVEQTQNPEPQPLPSNDPSVSTMTIEPMAANTTGAAAPLPTEPQAVPQPPQVSAPASMPPSPPPMMSPPTPPVPPTPSAFPTPPVMTPPVMPATQPTLVPPTPPPAIQVPPISASPANPVSQGAADPAVLEAQELINVTAQQINGSTSPTA